MGKHFFNITFYGWQAVTIAVGISQLIYAFRGTFGEGLYNLVLSMGAGVLISTGISNITESLNLANSMRENTRLMKELNDKLKEEMERLKNGQ